ncbi:MAG: ribbon-helix-helix domain-containing protein [Promethearchaeota archaeon]
MKIITINLSEPQVAALKTLQDLGLYPSRSEAIRVAIRDFLQKELGFAEAFESINTFSMIGKEVVQINEDEKKKEISRILRRLKEEQSLVDGIANY